MGLGPAVFLTGGGPFFFFAIKGLRLGPRGIYCKCGGLCRHFGTESGKKDPHVKIYRLIKFIHDAIELVE
jgi:hypothetical protein